MKESTQTMKDSGLFDEYARIKILERNGTHPKDLTPYGAGFWELTADQTEEILAAMGLQVVWDDLFSEWYLTGTSLWSKAYDGVELDAVTKGPKFKAPKGARTEANAAGVAWLCLNRKNELRETLIKLGKIK